MINLPVHIRPLIMAGVLFVSLLAGCAPAPASPTPTQQPTAVILPSPTAAPPTQSLPTAAEPGYPAAPTLAPQPYPAAPTEPPAQLPAAFPDPARYQWLEVAAGLNRPVFLADPNNGRMYIVEQPGVIRILKQGQLLTTPFLDIRSRVGSQGNEQGLLGLAFHPNFAKNGYFFLNYTRRDGNTVIARYQVSMDPEIADPATEKILLQVNQPYANHNGGMLAFGPDAYLYIGLGDGGSGGDPQGFGQSLDTLLGKILRIDINTEEAYTIPADNPFAAGGGKPEIYAYGLRNPWRFSFDRLNGDLWIADVGQNIWEEINYLPAGATPGVNFGWDYREGTHPFEGNPPQGLALADPVFEYNHDAGCSVTGGYVYRGASLPEWNGIYLLGDYCSGTVWGIMPSSSGGWQAQVLFQLDANIASFSEDAAGELYLLDLSGRVYRLAEQ